MGLEREALYAMDFPFVDYGLDLHQMAEMEKGIYVTKLTRSDIDANPPEAIKKKLEEKLSKVRCRGSDHIPEGFVGKGGKGYILKDWVIHRGKGAAKVSKKFIDAVRLTGTDKEYRMNKFLRLRMKVGGPRYAAMINCKKKY